VSSVIWLRKAADQGKADAQSALGNMYFVGKGVPKDYAQAAKWGRRAADQGDAAGQSLLEVMYLGGFGVPQDYVSAHMWSNLAAAGENKGAAETRNLAAARMTPAQIAEAQRLAREWKPKSTSR
jgi:uncharacterized protein